MWLKLNVRDKSIGHLLHFCQKNCQIGGSESFESSIFQKSKDNEYRQSSDILGWPEFFCDVTK